MSAFAVAAFYDPALPGGARALEAVVWIRAVDLDPDGVDVALELWTPASVAVTALREVAPGQADRLEGCVRVDERTLRIDAGRWRDGVHEFELVVALPAGGPGDELLAARVAVLAAGERVAAARVVVTWTEGAPDEAAPSPSGAEPTGGTDLDASRTAAVVAADLPTGASPQPRHTGAGDGSAAGPCSGCGALPEEGDRYCEACGRELAAG